MILEGSLLIMTEHSLAFTERQQGWGWSKVERILSPVPRADQATKTSLRVLVGGKSSKYLQSCLHWEGS